MNRRPDPVAFHERPTPWVCSLTLLTAVLFLGGLCGRADAQTTAGITGSITDAGTSAPLAGIDVRAYTASGTYVTSGTTNASGVYTLNVLAAGTYVLKTSNSLGYIDELYDNIPCPAGSACPVQIGKGVNVTAGATASGIDFGLTKAGTITGTVTDAATGAPLAAVSVQLYKADGTSAGLNVTTDAELTPGGYFLR